MRKADQIVARVLNAVQAEAKPGVSTLQLDQMAEDMIRQGGAQPAFKGYKGQGPYPFPGTLCTSINEEVVHGIPSADRKLADGDILSVDCGAQLDGFYGDAAVTLPIGQVSETAERLLRVTREALELAIEQTRPGKRVSDIGAVIQDHVEAEGFSVSTGADAPQGASELNYILDRLKGTELLRVVVYVNAHQLARAYAYRDGELVAAGPWSSARFEHEFYY